MAWSGGNFTRANPTWVSDAAALIGIEPLRHDNQDNDFTTGINECLNKTGQNQMTGNLNLGGFLPTNIGAGTAAAPALCMNNDVNTGLFSPAADQIGIATNGTEKIRITDTGRLGIGTTTPTSALQVTGQIDSIPDAVGVHIGMVGTAYGCVELVGSTGSIIDFTDAGVDNKGRIIYTNADNVMAFATNNVERMRVVGSGEVLVDSTASISTAYKFQVGSAAGGQTNVGFAGPSGTAGGAQLAFFGAGSPSIQIGNYSAIAGGAFDNRSTIKNNGASFVVLGITAAVGTHFMKWNNATGAWTYDTSSARYKDNIEDSSYGLAEVLAMRPVTFTYKAEPERHDVGFIAEEMVSVIPEVVAKTTEGEPDAISYDRLTSVLCKAIQELNSKVEALEARIAVLEA